MRLRIPWFAALVVAAWCAIATPAAAQSFGAGGTISTAGAACATATDCVAFSIDGIPSFGFYLDVGTSGTFNFEVSGTSGSSPTDASTGTWTAWTDMVAGASTATADGRKFFSNPGARRFRIRASAINGAATVETPSRGFGTSSSGGGGGAVTNAGTFAVQEDGAALAALQLIDNVVSVEDAPAGSAFSGVGMLAVRQDSHSDLAADGDFIPLTVDADGGLRVTTTGASTVTTTSDDQQAEDDAVAYALTLPTVISLLYCDNGANFERCPTGDGGAGAATANTSRVVEATTTDERYISVGSTEDENEICAAACTFVSVQVSNNHASANAFLKCTNLTAANTTPGTSTIVWDILVPFGLTVVDVPNKAMSTALTCYIVLGEADNDVAEVAANDVRYSIRTR